MAGQRFNSSQVSNWGQPINTLPRQPQRTAAETFGAPNVQSIAAGGGTAWNSVVADRGAGWFFAVTTPITISSVAVRVTTSAVSGELRAGIYYCKSDSQVGELVADFGVLDAS